MASSTAGIPDYYGTPETIQAFKDFLRSSNYPLKGFMMWNSHWDQLNKNAISKACTS